MLAHADIQRSVARMTVNLHRAIEHRKSLIEDYGLAERLYQTQYEFSGHVGTLPAEGEITIPFAIQFVADPGNQRDSQLDRPHVNLTIELLSAPGGMIPYAYLKRWKQDDDFNFTGAVVQVGVHSPGVAIAGALPTRFRYHGVLHASFQGYAAPWDVDGPLDGGGTQDDTGTGN